MYLESCRFACDLACELSIDVVHAVASCVTKIFQGKQNMGNHDDVTKWKHIPRYWPFLRGIHRSFDIFFDKCLSSNRETGNLRRNRGHYEVIVMSLDCFGSMCTLYNRYIWTQYTDHHIIYLSVRLFKQWPSYFKFVSAINKKTFAVMITTPSIM